jgi:Peptidase_C39 like family
MRGNPNLATDMSESDQFRKENPKKLRFFALTAIFVGIVAGGAWYYYGTTGIIPSSGGLYFFRFELPVHRFAQADPRWADDALGQTQSTMAEEGCAVSSSAMVLAYFGQDIDPGRLNAFLTTNGGYTPQGWLYWEKAAAFIPGMVRHAYEDLPSYFLIDSNLLRGNPVIVRVHLPNGITHFVVIVGKIGFDYLIQDPALGGEFGTYPLQKLAPKIEALRFYERIQS